MTTGAGAGAGAAAFGAECAAGTLASGGVTTIGAAAKVSIGGMTSVTTSTVPGIVSTGPVAIVAGTTGVVAAAAAAVVDGTGAGTGAGAGAGAAGWLALAMTLVSANTAVADRPVAAMRAPAATWPPVRLLGDGPGWRTWACGEGS